MKEQAHVEMDWEGSDCIFYAFSNNALTALAYSGYASKALQGGRCLPVRLIGMQVPYSKHRASYTIIPKFAPNNGSIVQW